MFAQLIEQIYNKCGSCSNFVLGFIVVCLLPFPEPYDVFTLNKVAIDFIACIILGASLGLIYAVFSLSSMFVLGKSYNVCSASKKCEKNGIISTYLLNLDRARERLKCVTPNVKSLDEQFIRISAVDGNALSHEEIIGRVDVVSFMKFFRMLPERGTIGCSLSHEKAWRHFLENTDDEFALIFEDDIEFDVEKMKIAIESAKKHSGLWDILSFELNHHGCPLRVQKFSDDMHLSYYLFSVKHSGAYMINRKAAHKLLKKFYPIKMPFDHYFTRAWEFDIKFAGIEGRIAGQSIGSSQIKVGKTIKCKTLQIRLCNIFYNIGTSFTCFIYNVSIYIYSRIRVAFK